ncbi:MAG: hypothetical protein OEW04_01390 [Nitrospirota bacterium]|nr:hypothetical protein [Nitrospirota bacterium]
MTLITKLSELTGAKKNALSVLLIAAIAFIIYSNTFDASFHFDDTPSIVENYAIHRFDIKQIFSGSTRPVLDLTFAVNYYFGKLDVFGYHLVNLLLHIANGVMLYFILMWTMQRNEEQRVKGSVQAVMSSAMSQEPGAKSYYSRIPLYASLIFIAHPVQTQAVTYIVSRSSVLATFFYLLTFVLFIKAIRSRNSMPYFACAFVSACLGMGTKQEAATLPVMLMLYDYYFLSDGKLDGLKKYFRFHLAISASLLVVFYLSMSNLQMFVSFDYSKGVSMPQGESITSFQYFLTQLNVIPYYIRLLFVPANLNLDYDWPITRHIDFMTAFYSLLLLSIVVLAVWLFRRQRLISFGIIWFFVTLTVTSSFVVIYDVIFEHRLYLPSIGFALVLSVFISKITRIKS